MEVVDGTQTASQVAPEDLISCMPDIVISNIMNRLPIQEAVSTGILSKDWRYKWTLLTQLVFDEHFGNFLEETGNDGYFSRIISRVLLNLSGKIESFVVLNNRRHSVMDVEDINNWVLFLSKRGLKKLTLINCSGLRLTSHLFSCLELTHLELRNCLLGPASDFRGFPNLTSLVLAFVLFERYRCGEFLTRCPNLQTLKLFCETTYETNEAEIAKLGNLRVLDLTLCTLKKMSMITTSLVFTLVGQLTKLQQLRLDFSDCEISADAKRSVPATLPCLKDLSLLSIDFSSKIMVSFVFELISGSPNLDTLRIDAVRVDVVSPGSSLVDYSRMGQLQLRKFQLFCSSGLENEEYLINSLLACSPFLEKVVIDAKFQPLFGDGHKQRDFATKLLKLRRASPIAEIDIRW